VVPRSTAACSTGMRLRELSRVQASQRCSHSIDSCGPKLTLVHASARGRSSTRGDDYSMGWISHRRGGPCIGGCSKRLFTVTWPRASPQVWSR
jgi:hypothetical protein